MFVVWCSVVLFVVCGMGNNTCNHGSPLAGGAYYMCIRNQSASTLRQARCYLYGVACCWVWLPHSTTATWHLPCLVDRLCLTDSASRAKIRHIPAYPKNLGHGLRLVPTPQSAAGSACLGASPTLWSWSAPRPRSRGFANDTTSIGIGRPNLKCA